VTRLPPGWAECEIGQMAAVKGGGTPSSNDESNFTETGGIPWITPADLSGYKEVYISRGRRNLTRKGFESCSATLLPRGSVLFSSRAPVGYVAIARTDLATNQGFKSFVLPPELDSRYVYYYLRHIRPLAEQRATGTTFKELSGANAARLPLIVAPIHEQKRIADKLDALLKRVDSCSERLGRMPEILKRFRQSVFAAAASGKLTEEWRQRLQGTYSASDLSGWRTGSFMDFFDIEGGTQPPKSTFISEPREGYVRLLQIRDFGEKPVPTYIPDRPSLKKCKPDDILLGRYGASVGRVCTGLTGAYNVALTKVVTHEHFARGFPAILLSAPDFYNAINGFQRSAQDGFNKNDLQRINVSIPPLEEQAEIVRRVEALLAGVDRVEERYDAVRMQVESLLPALLTKAFCGALVPAS
jgi:type I restriction enzyme, S subunit